MCDSDYQPNFYDNPNYNIPDECTTDHLEEKETMNNE